MPFGGMDRRSLIAAMLALPGVASAQTVAPPDPTEIIKLWPNGAPRPRMFTEVLRGFDE